MIAGGLLLWLLATADSACAGFRAVAGRSGLIRKGPYYARAMLVGCAYAQVAVLVAGTALFCLWYFATDRAAVNAGLLQAAHRLLLVYLPYAAAIGGGFLIRIYPSVDLRSITSTAIFGPLSLIRPAVAMLGVSFAIWGQWWLLPIGAAILLMMLTAEYVLGRLLRA